MFNDTNEIKEIISKYEKLYHQVYAIVELHGKLEDCCYEIKNIEYYEPSLNVEVEYYKWQDNNYACISVDTNLLTDKTLYESFVQDMNSKIKEKNLVEELKEQEKKNENILKAIELLKANGINIK